MTNDTALTAMFFGVFAGGMLVMTVDCLRGALRQRRTRQADIDYVNTLLRDGDQR